ncbi:MAG: hypothetical protein KIY10_10945 [Thermoplasmata archaeon]|nr:hypothetical protein [Candidatus Sysuiplasma jiujiangense]
MSLSTEPIIQESLNDLKFILAGMDEYNRKHRRAHPAVLIGGWAVFAFNAYYGSVDIDLVTSSNSKKFIYNMLTKRLNYHKQSSEFGFHSIYRPSPAGRIVVEFASREEDFWFEGRREKLDFNILNGNCIVREFQDLRATIPNREVLFLMKLKAAYDRSARLENGTSPDPPWERGKVEKDRSDIIALVDTNDALNLKLLKEYLDKFPFLLKTLESVVNEASASKYGKPIQYCIEIHKRLLSLLNV